MGEAVPLRLAQPRSPAKAQCATRVFIEEKNTLDDWPVSGLATHRSAFPRTVRSDVVTFLAERSMNEAAYKKRAWNDLQLALRSLTVAGAAQVGSSLPDSRPVSRLTASAKNAGASTKSAASVQEMRGQETAHRA